MAYNSFVLTKKKVLLNSLFYQLTLAVCVCVCTFWTESRNKMFVWPMWKFHLFSCYVNFWMSIQCTSLEVYTVACDIFHLQISFWHWMSIPCHMLRWSRHVFFIFPHVCVHHKAKIDDDKKKLRKFQFAWKWLENKQPRKVYIKLGNVYHSY